MSALGAGAGAQQAQTFRVYVSDGMLKKRLQKTKEYSQSAGQNKMFYNCANLTVVLLGLIEKEDKYLDTCVKRDRGTVYHELDLITQSVCKKAGIKYLGREYSGTGKNLQEDDTHMTVTDVTQQFPFTTQLINIGETLPKSYATFLGVIFADGVNHTCLLRKSDSGLLELVDPQILGVDKKYPLRYIISGSVDCNPFRKVVTQIIHFEGPSIDPKHLRLAKSNIANIVMQEEPTYISPSSSLFANSAPRNAAATLPALTLRSNDSRVLRALPGERTNNLARLLLASPNEGSIVSLNKGILRAPGRESAMNILRAFREKASVDISTTKKNTNTNKKPQNGGERRGTRKHRSKQPKN